VRGAGGGAGFVAIILGSSSGLDIYVGNLNLLSFDRCVVSLKRFFEDAGWQCCREEKHDESAMLFCLAFCPE
jgi:hypothetical protein